MDLSRFHADDLFRFMDDRPAVADAEAGRGWEAGDKAELDMMLEEACEEMNARRRPPN